MPTRIVVRAAAAALSLSIVATGVAFADNVNGDADVVVAGTQSMINLGTVPGGSVRVVEVGFELACTGTTHAAPGSTIVLTPTTSTVPAGGAMDATPASIGPVPADWPAADEPCVDDPVLAGTARSQVRLTAPSAQGTYTYKVVFGRAPATGTSGTTSAQFVLSVPANTPPQLHLPADHTVEADTTGGWTASFTATATDAEDATNPSVQCDPAPGDLVPLGTTTVSCSATDTAGAKGTDGFTVKVVDTTAPDLGKLPAPVATATDASGVTVTYALPSAHDIADPSPEVTCLPASGSTFPVGTTTVACTATDASGNAAHDSFPVRVELRRATVAGSFDTPLGQGWTSSHLGRTLPVKATVTIDGARVGGAGPAPSLRAERVDGCTAGAQVLSSVALGALRWNDGRWTRNVDTSSLGAGCWRLVVSVDGVDGPWAGLALGDDADALTKPKTSKGG